MTRRYRIDDLAALTVPEQPALSPDGSQILYVLRTVDAEADKNVRAIWTVGTRDGEPRRLTRGTAVSSFERRKTGIPIRAAGRSFL